MPKTKAKIFADKGICLGKVEDRSDVANSIKAAGGRCTVSVTKLTTHVVCTDEELESAKVKRALSKGLPVLDVEWITESLANGKLANEADFELDIDDGSGDDNDDKKKKADSKKRKAAGSAAAKKKGKAKAKAPPSDDDGDADDGSGSDDDDKKSDDDVKMTTVVRKGRAPVDKYALMQIGQNVHVLDEGGVVYDAMLNQTNIAGNNNKFYVIQVLARDDGASYYAWTRWGRVGVPGQNKLVPCSANKARAIAEFKKKFHDKTRNHWDDRANFVAKKGKYTLIDVSYGEDEEEELKAKSGTVKVEIPPSKLDKQVQSLVETIFDLKMMEQTMIQLQYDVKKMPLGKLTKSHIKRGYAVLKELEEELNATKTSQRTLSELTSQFYTLIPHDFGFKRPPVINDVPTLKTKMQMLEALADIEIATGLLKANKGATGNPIDQNYLKLKTELVPVKRLSADWKMVFKYVSNTHGATHTSYKLELLDVFKVAREGEEARYSAWEDNTNRQLLWHGSRLTNYVGILSQGLRIAPPEAPVTGYMFGKGVYFADMVSKSANYCRTNKANPIGLMMLCDVALGDMNELKQANYHADKLPKGKLSTKGLGQTAPKEEDAVYVEDGKLKVPLGKGGKSGVTGTSLLYNEYIVYDVSQIRVRYLLRLKFHHKW